MLRKQHKFTQGDRVRNSNVFWPLNNDRLNLHTNSYNISLTQQRFNDSLGYLWCVMYSCKLIFIRLSWIYLLPINLTLSPVIKLNLHTNFYNISVTLQRLKDFHSCAWGTCEHTWIIILLHDISLRLLRSVNTLN